MQVIKHWMFIEPLLVMYNAYYFWNNFKNNLRTLSGWFLTKHRPINKSTVSLNPKISVLYAGVYSIKYSEILIAEPLIYQTSQVNNAFFIFLRGLKNWDCTGDALF